MRIKVNFSALKQIKFHEYLTRFVLGGLVTVATGLVAMHWGPVIGGLFLAFPAIFPAGATLLEEHEVQKKREIGRDGRRRGRNAVALDAQGAALGTMGLAAFALVLWRWLPRHNSAVTLVFATVAWLMVSGSLWVLRKWR